MYILYMPHYTLVIDILMTYNVFNSFRFCLDWLRLVLSAIYL